MPVVCGAVVEGDLALHPRQLAPPGLFAQHRVLVRNQRCDDAATGHVVVVDQHEAARHFELGVEIERDRGAESES